MYRTFKVMNEEKAEVGKLAQILDNEVTTRFPVISKGINLKPVIPNDYGLGGETIGKIDDRIVSIVESDIYITKYEGGMFTQLATFRLGAGDSTVRVKVVDIAKNKSIITYGNRGSLNLYLLSTDGKDNFTLSKSLTISNNIKVNKYDAIALTKTRMVVSYLELEEGISEKTKPTYQTIDIEGGVLKVTQSPMAHGTEDNFIWTPYLTRISENEFLGSATTVNLATNSSRAMSTNTVFSISSIGVIESHESFEYMGYYASELSTIAPKYLQDGRILTVECVNDWDTEIVVREIDKSLPSGIYRFNALSSISLSGGEWRQLHNIDFLQTKADGSKDYMAFNSYLINIIDNSTVSLVERYIRLNIKNISYQNHNNYPTVMLKENLILLLDDNNDFQMYSYHSSNGLIIGIVKDSTGDSCSVDMTGLVRVVGADITTGKKVYCDVTGHISNLQTGRYLGYAVSSDSFILRRSLSRIPRIVSNDGMGYKHNGKIYYHGYIPYIDESIINGAVYYLDGLGQLTTSLTDTQIGMGVGKGLYVRGGYLKRQASTPIVPDIPKEELVISGDIEFSIWDENVPYTVNTNEPVTWTLQENKAIKIASIDGSTCYISPVSSRDIGEATLRVELVSDPSQFAEFLLQLFY